MFKLPNLGLIVTIFKAGVVVGVFVGAAAGALAGAAGGLLTAPTSGKKLRARIKEDTEKGVQTLSENGEKLKEQGLNLMGKIGSQFESASSNQGNSADSEIVTEEPLAEQDGQMTPHHNGSKNGSKRRRSA